MARKRYTEEQIIAVLSEAEAGARTADLCRRHGRGVAVRQVLIEFGFGGHELWTNPVRHVPAFRPGVTCRTIGRCPLLPVLSTPSRLQPHQPPLQGIVALLSPGRIRTCPPSVALAPTRLLPATIAFPPSWTRPPS